MSLTRDPGKELVTGLYPAVWIDRSAQGTARLLGQTLGASLVALLLARYPAEGTQISLMVGVGFALFGAALSMLRLSSAGARGAEAIRVHESQRLKGE